MDGKGSTPRSSGGGGVSAFCKGEALYASECGTMDEKGGRDDLLTEEGDWGIFEQW